MPPAEAFEELAVISARTDRTACRNSDANSVSLLTSHFHCANTYIHEYIPTVARLVV